MDPEGLYDYSSAGAPVDTATGNALTCFEECVGQNLTVTGAKEGGHIKGGAHETGQACDLSEKRNPGITDNPKNAQCFSQCFPAGSFGQFESNPPHLHLQTRPGKGGASGFRPKK
jgi:hypothetical protein